MSRSRTTLALGGAVLLCVAGLGLLTTPSPGPLQAADQLPGAPGARRMPVVPRVQMTRWSPTSSGAAALGTVLAAYGQQHPPERLEQACGGVGQRATLAGMEQAARSARFRAAIVATDLPSLARAPLPAVAEWPDREFRVFIATRGAAVEVFDPGTGQRAWLGSEALAGWTGRLLLLHPHTP